METAAAPSRKPQRGDELDLRVDALAFGGNGVARLDGLTPAELRRVRDYERRHGNRKSVPAAVERKLR